MYFILLPQYALPSLRPFLPDGLIDHPKSLVHPICTSKVLGKEPEVLLYGDILGISVRDSGVKLWMAGMRGGGWRSFEIGEQFLHFDKLKIRKDLLSEQYLASHSG